MNHLKIGFLAMAISAVVLTGCANAETEATLPSGTYVTNVSDGQRDALIVDWTNKKVAFLKEGASERLLIGHMSLQKNHVTCVFEDQGIELSFFILKNKTLQYQGNKRSGAYNLQMVRDLVSCPIFQYSWVETVKHKWKVIVYNCGRDFFKDCETGN